MGILECFAHLCHNQVSSLCPQCVYTSEWPFDQTFFGGTPCMVVGSSCKNRQLSDIIINYKLRDDGKLVWN